MHMLRVSVEKESQGKRNPNEICLKQTENKNQPRKRKKKKQILFKAFLLYILYVFYIYVFFT